MQYSTTVPWHSHSNLPSFCICTDTTAIPPLCHQFTNKPHANQGRLVHKMLQLLHTSGHPPDGPLLSWSNSCPGPKACEEGEDGIGCTGGAGLIRKECWRWRWGRSCLLPLSWLTLSLFTWIAAVAIDIYEAEAMATAKVLDGEAACQGALFPQLCCQQLCCHKVQEWLGTIHEQCPKQEQYFWIQHPTTMEFIHVKAWLDHQHLSLFPPHALWVANLLNCPFTAWGPFADCDWDRSCPRERDKFRIWPRPLMPESVVSNFSWSLLWMPSSIMWDLSNDSPPTPSLSHSSSSGDPIIPMLGFINITLHPCQFFPVCSPTSIIDGVHHLGERLSHTFDHIWRVDLTSWISESCLKNPSICPSTHSCCTILALWLLLSMILNIQPLYTHGWIYYLC